MTVLTQHTAPKAPAAQRSHRRTAWLLVGITPVGLAVSGVIWLWLLDVLRAVSSLRDQLGASFDLFSTVFALAVAGTIALAAPSVAVIVATAAGREEGRTAHRVLVGSWAAFVLCTMVFGLFGLIVWGPVLNSGLQERAP